MEVEVSPQALEAAKGQVDKDIQQYTQQHPGSDVFDYFDNFRLWLIDRTGSAMDYRGSALKNTDTPHRETLRDPSPEYAKLFSERYLNNTGAEFVADINKAMGYAKVTTEQMTQLENKFDEVRYDKEAFRKLKEEIVEKIRPAFVFMIALGYKRYPELAS